MKGYVYAVLNPITGQVKIGCATNPSTSLHTLRQQAQIPFKLLAFEHSVDAVASEQAVHAALAGHHRYGEWYTLTTLQLADLEDLIRAWAESPPRRPREVTGQPTLKKRLAHHLTRALNTRDQPLAQVAQALNLTHDHLQALKDGAPQVQLEEMERLLNRLGYEILDVQVERGRK